MDKRKRGILVTSRLYESFPAGTLAVQATKLDPRVVFWQSRLGDANTPQ